MAEREESHGEIDWAAADVSDGTLTVPLTGEPSKDWAARVTDVLDRLGRGRGEWGDIAVEPEQITVKDVGAGAEGDLRHLLEGAVMQANADHAAPEPEADADADAEGRSAADGEQAEAFRSFAPKATPASEDDDE